MKPRTITKYKKTKGSSGVTVLLTLSHEAEFLSRLCCQSFCDFKIDSEARVGVTRPNAMSHIIFDFAKHFSQITPEDFKVNNGNVFLFDKTSISYGDAVKLVKSIENQRPQFDDYVKRHPLYPVAANLHIRSMPEHKAFLEEILSFPECTPVKVSIRHISIEIGKQPQPCFAFPPGHVATESLMNFMRIKEILICCDNSAGDDKLMICLPVDSVIALYAEIHAEANHSTGLWRRHVTRLSEIDSLLRSTKAPYCMPQYLETSLYIPETYLANDIFKEVASNLTPNQKIAHRQVNFDTLVNASEDTFQQIIFRIHCGIRYISYCGNMTILLAKMEFHHCGVVPGSTVTETAALFTMNKRSAAIMRTLFTGLNAAVVEVEAGMICFQVPIECELLRSEKYFTEALPSILETFRVIKKFEELCGTYKKLVAHFAPQYFTEKYATIYDKVSRMSQEELVALQQACLNEINMKKQEEVRWLARLHECQQLLTPILGNLHAWHETQEASTIPLQRNYIHLIQHLNLPFLQVMDDKSASIAIIHRHCRPLSTENWTRESNYLHAALAKTHLLDTMICRVRLNQANRFRSDGIYFSFKDAVNEAHLRGCLQEMALLEKVSDEPAVYRITYTAILRDSITLANLQDKQKQLDACYASSGKQEEDKIEKPVVRLKASANSSANKKKSTKQQHTKPKAAEIKPAAPKQKVKLIHSNIPPQTKCYDMPSKEKEGRYVCVDVSMVNPDQTAVFSIPAPQPAASTTSSLMPRTAHDGALQNELDRLASVHCWFQELDLSSQKEVVCQNILAYNTWIGMVRLLNAIELRIREDKKAIPLTEDRYEASRAAFIRGILLHYLPDAKFVEEFYQTLRRQGIEEATRLVIQHEKPAMPINFKMYRHRFFAAQRSTFDPQALLNEVMKNLLSFLTHYENNVDKILNRSLAVVSVIERNAALDHGVAYYVHELRAMEACLTMIGELYPSLSANHPFSRDMVMFMQSCRRVRNVVSHNNIFDIAAGFNPMPVADILSKARELRLMLSGCANKLI